MNVFISWSGETSKRLAKVFKGWLPMVLQNVTPFFSDEDIEAGSDWQRKISSELERCKVGIFLVTRDNYKSPWLIFEAGAMSTKKRVCTVFFDLKLSEVKGPLMQFHGVSFQRDHILKLIASINDSLETHVEPHIFRQAFRASWPILEEKVRDILVKNDCENQMFLGEPADRETVFSVKSWGELLSVIEDLHQHFQKKNILIDYIVSFAGGGLLVADLLHVIHRPKIPVVSCVIRRYEAPRRASSRHIEIVFPLIDKRIFANKSILLLDDAVNTGNSMLEVEKFLAIELNARKVYAAVLGKAAHTPFKMHYYGFEYTGQCVLPYASVPRELPMIDSKD